MRWKIEPPDAKRGIRSVRMPGPESERTAHLLHLIMQRQELVRWCWAAIACSLGSYYGTRSVRQRELASELLGLDCEHVGVDGDAAGRCNVEAMLDDALRLAGCYSHWSPGRPSFERIRSEIDAGCPVCLCVDWKTGGSHYAAISGYFADTRELYVADPLHGPSIQRYDTFPDGYQGNGGYWRGTFWTGAMTFQPNSYPDERSE